ncbi:hypothetical protein RUM44_003608 [Polyplax serrata]|uniref:Uncharacterized protein n=1 Tax=Polyplax serrata TaxID=468196 RepID=A0ABR1AGY4_POLSC
MEDGSVSNGSSRSVWPILCLLLLELPSTTKLKVQVIATKNNPRQKSRSEGSTLHVVKRRTSGRMDGVNSQSTPTPNNSANITQPFPTRHNKNDNAVLQCAVYQKKQKDLEVPDTQE